MPGKCLHTLHVCDMPCKRHPCFLAGFSWHRCEQAVNSALPPTVLCKQDHGGPRGDYAFWRRPVTSPQRKERLQQGSGPSRAAALNCPCFKTQSILSSGSCHHPARRPHHSCFSPPCRFDFRNRSMTSPVPLTQLTQSQPYISKQ